MQTRALMPICIVGLCGLIAMPGLVQGSPVPQLINYQGRLTASEGGPLPTKDYKLSFSIYDKPAAVSCQRQAIIGCAHRIWGPQVFDGQNGRGRGDRVPVVKGFFNVILGPYDTRGRPIAKAFTSAFASSDRFVEVTVEDAEPNLPRQQVFSTPFALGSLGGTPVGGIIMFNGAPIELPGNWRLCNGQRVGDRDSPFYGKNVPDLRNVFVRGAGIHSDVGKYGGLDRPGFTHRHNISATGLASRESLNGWRSAPLLCLDDMDDPRKCDSDNLHFGMLSDMQIIENPKYRALIKSTSSKDEKDSHGHDVSISASVGESRITLDNRPRHIKLHYIIRIK